MALPNLTDAQVISQLDSGRVWPGASITYSFPTSPWNSWQEQVGFSALAPAAQEAAHLTIQLWDELTDADFNYVANASGANSNIEFAYTTTGPSYAWAYYPTTGSVWFNPAYNSGTSDLVTPDIGRHGFLTFIHEIGHAIGLNHMGNYNGSGATPQSYQDSTVFSVMSYFGPSWGSGAANGEGLVAWADWRGVNNVLYSPQTPMLNDVMAIQAMYGVETTMRAGDTVYGFNSNISGRAQDIFDFSRNANPILTIFDSGGNDTLDLSGWSTSSTVDLAPGAYSSANGMTSNIAIAYTAVIENAVGGSGNDLITGNEYANVLTGGAGNDSLAGDLGNDTIVGAVFDDDQGVDNLDGGADDDWIYADWNDLAQGGSGYDHLVARGTAGLTVDIALTGFEETWGGAFADTFDGSGVSGQSLRLRGSGGNDILIGGTAADRLYGGADNDLLQGNGGNDYLKGEAGIDTLEGGPDNDSLVGGAGNDVLRGEGGNDYLIGATGLDAEGVDNLDGGSGDDWFFADASDTIQGGSGRDKLVAQGPVGLNVDLAATSIEETWGGDFADVFDGSGVIDAELRLRGNAGADTLIGGALDDKLFGGSENDLLQGNGGGDYLKGEGGVDRLEGGAGRDFLVGGADNDTLLGGSEIDYLIGATGLDAEGVDFLDGGAGDDWLFADALDTIQGGEGRDNIIARGPTGLNVDLAATSIEDTWGGAFADVFDGSGVDGKWLRLRGSGGDDTLIGGAWGDRLFGGADNDLLQGNGGGDRLKAEGGNDTLEGGSGFDTLIGGAGLDILLGGTEADTFLATDYDGNTDEIGDYSFAQGDKVDGTYYQVIGLDTFVYDALDNALFQLTAYNADIDGIIFV